MSKKSSIKKEEIKMKEKYKLRIHQFAKQGLEIRLTQKIGKYFGPIPEEIDNIIRKEVNNYSLSDESSLGTKEELGSKLQHLGREVAEKEYSQTEQEEELTLEEENEEPTLEKQKKEIKKDILDAENIWKHKLSENIPRKFASYSDIQKIEAKNLLIDKRWEKIIEDLVDELDDIKLKQIEAKQQENKFKLIDPGYEE